MWKLIFGGITKIFESWIEMKRAKHEAEAKRALMLAEVEATYDLEAQRNMRYSWKDEIITIIWFSPLAAAWFYPEEAKDWVAFVRELPYFYQVGIFGIMAATFGLRWYFKQQNVKIVDKEGK